MKNFLELTDTDLTLEVEISNLGEIDKYTLPLLDPIKITISKSASITIDGILIEDWRLKSNGEQLLFETNIPFYQWLHHATAQGWLLEPS